MQEIMGYLGLGRSLNFKMYIWLYVADLYCWRLILIKDNKTRRLPRLMTNLEYDILCVISRCVFNIK